jgi:hypothetical protein
MKISVLLAVLLLVTLAAAQTTTTHTDCQIYGSTADCTSTSTSDAAAQAAQAERQREAYETGQQIGRATAIVIQNARARRFVKNFCKKNGDGATWWYQFNGQPKITGTCGE